MARIRDQIVGGLPLRPTPTAPGWRDNDNRLPGFEPGLVATLQFLDASIEPPDEIASRFSVLSSVNPESGLYAAS